MITSLVKRCIPESLVRRRLPAAAGSSVLLTFDDGPAPGVTEHVLDRLDAFGARAVFFLVGRKIPDGPALVAEIRNRGHLLGNHSFAHDASRWQSPTAWRRDLDRCTALIQDNDGGPCRLYRPPEGKLTPLTVFGTGGLHHVQWSLDSDDWSVRDEREAAERGRRTAAAATAGDIILCHDFHSSAPALLDELLPRLANAGLDLAGGAAHLPGGAAA